MASPGVATTPRRRPSGATLGNSTSSSSLNRQLYVDKPLPGTPRPQLKPSSSKAYLLNRVPGASQIYVPPSQTAERRTVRDRSKPPTCQPFGQHSVLARAASQPALQHAYQSPNARMVAMGRGASAAGGAPIDYRELPPSVAALMMTPPRTRNQLLPEGAAKPIIREGERTLFGTSRAEPTLSRSNSASSRSGVAPSPLTGSKRSKNKIPPPREIKIDFQGIWHRFVERSLHPEADLEVLIQEKSEHPHGKSSAEFSPFHAIPILPQPWSHSFVVTFNPDPNHLAKWRSKAGLDDLPPPDERYMEELFWQVVYALEKNFGWLRHVHDEVTAMDPTARHYVLRPGIHYSYLPQPDQPLRDRIDTLYLPASPQVFLSRSTSFWKSSIAQQFSSLRAHRHPTLGLVFNRWMNNPQDVLANADAVPPPVWFLLYAMQAAYPGLFVIREETENEGLLQTIERGLPPYEVLADRGCGLFFMGLLGERGYTDVCEAALDARTSTVVEVLIKGSVRPRKRSRSHSNNGLPPMPDDGKSGFRRLLRKPSWLSRWQSP